MKNNNKIAAPRLKKIEREPEIGFSREELMVILAGTNIGKGGFAGCIMENFGQFMNRNQENQNEEE